MKKQEIGIEISFERLIVSERIEGLINGIVIGILLGSIITITLSTAKK